MLKQVGVHPQAREVVFFGTDRGAADVAFRQQTYKLDQQFGRSVTLENAMKPEPLLAYAMNGDPLTLNQGFPVRLMMPGWYGVANVKWLAEVHLQEDRYLGNYQARWYRSVVGVGGTGEDTDPETQWVETEITRMHLKSAIARVRKTGGALQVLGFVLNDGTPLKSVEVKIDDGPWQKATLDPGNTQYSWKLFTYRWEGATPGEHTLVSRVTDANGNGATRRRRFEPEEDVPPGQRAVPAQSHDRLSRQARPIRRRFRCSKEIDGGCGALPA